MQEQWKRCAFYTNRALGFATGAIFVRETGQEGSVTNVSVFLKINFLVFLQGRQQNFLSLWWVTSLELKAFLIGTPCACVLVCVCARRYMIVCVCEFLYILFLLLIDSVCCLF